MQKHLFTIASRAGITERVGRSPRHRSPREMTMSAKAILIAALVLAGTSLTFVASASAATARNSEAHPSVRQSPLCPPDHSYQECFYGG
jgi:hypothetical protein